MTANPSAFYTDRLSTLVSQKNALQKKRSMFAWLRLALAALWILAISHWWGKDYITLALVTILLLAAFLWLVVKSVNTNLAIDNCKRLIDINEQELQVLQGKYYSLPAIPKGISNYETNEAFDLDLFGHASLFQYINRSHNEFAQAAMANALTQLPNREVVLQKQEAVKELAGMMEWCQQLQSHSNASPLQISDMQNVQEWAQESKNELSSWHWQALRILVPLASFTTLLLYLTDRISDGVFNTIMLLILAFVFSFYKRISQMYMALSKQVPALQSLAYLLEHIETANFTSPLLQSLQQTLLTKPPASASVKKLKQILKRFDLRLNPVVHIPLSIFLFWDLQQALALQRWKKQQESAITNWHQTSAQFELLAAIAVLHFNNPYWVFPTINEQWFSLSIRQAGHPLLAASKAVLNNYQMQGTPAVNLITGSNMAGKSTFLRTIGTNMILGMAGAPVHAAQMEMPVCRLVSSMRITDNLEEATSTFYAELKKMKRIVDAVNAGEKVFVLIDEMLRGTNSLDRHTGAVALVKQLVHKNAVAVIASHDVALSALQNEFPNAINNFHFDSTIIQEEIVFDYKLKEGVCQSTNASLLMKKIGIEL